MVELLVALALVGGVAYLVSRLAVQGVTASRGVVEGAQAAGNLSEGLSFLRSRLEAFPVPFFLAGEGSSFAAVQRVSATPLPVVAASRGQDTLTLSGSFSLAQGELLLLYGPQGDVTAVRVLSATASGGNTQVQVSCNLPYSLSDGLRVYRARSLYVALGSATGAQGADPKTLYWSEDGVTWRPVVGGMAAFQVGYRYRLGGVGAALDDPQGFRPGSYPLPYLEVGGQGYYLSELVLYARPESGERDFQAIVSLGLGDAAGRVKRIVGCALPSATPRGTLQVQVSGLPSGTDARVRVTGPGGYAQDLTASADLTVVPGSYTVSAQGVWVGTTLYTAQVSGSPAQVTDGGTATVTVVYRTADLGTLQVQVSGLPQGALAPVSVREASSGTLVGQDSLANGSRDFQVPSGRQYDVRGEEVQAGGQTYRVQGANPVRSSTVLAGRTASVSLPYYCATCPATLQVNVVWQPAKPAGAQADVVVYKPDGSWMRLIDSATLNTTAGSHTVAASSVVAPDGLLYQPAVSPSSLNLAPGATGSVTVTYTAAQGRLRVRVVGLPSGLEGEWNLQGPQGALGPYRGLDVTTVLPTGTYTVEPRDLFPNPNVMYRGTASPNPVTLGPAETKEVLITYQEVRLWNLKVVLDTNGGLYPNEKGPAAVLNGTVYDGSPNGEVYKLPEGTYTLGNLGYVLSMGQGDYGTFYDTTSFMSYRFYPCDYPTQSCASVSLFPNSSFTLQGNSVLVVGASDLSEQYFAPAVRVRFRFPQSLAGQTVTVPYEARSVNLETGSVSSDSELQQATVRLDSSGQGELDQVWFYRRNLSGGSSPTGGLDLRFQSVSVNGVTYYPRVRRFAVSGQAALAGLANLVVVDYASTLPASWAIGYYDLFHVGGGTAYGGPGNGVSWSDGAGLRLVSVFRMLPVGGKGLRVLLERDVALGNFSLSNSNLGLVVGRSHPAALYSATSAPGGTGTFSLSPQLAWRRYNGTGFQDQPFSSYSLVNFGPGDRLYILPPSGSAAGVFWPVNGGGVVEDGDGIAYMRPRHTVPVDSLRNPSAGSVYLPPGQYTLRLRGRPASPSVGQITVRVYSSNGVLQQTLQGTPCIGRICTEVNFQVPDGGWVAVDAGF